jgi:hypothetical protein
MFFTDYSFRLIIQPTKGAHLVTSSVNKSFTVSFILDNSEAVVEENYSHVYCT